VSAVYPNYQPAWCGKTTPAGYEQFRSAFEDYQKAIEDVLDLNAGVIADLGYTCQFDGPGATGPKPANPTEVDLIVTRLSMVARPAIDRAGAAWNRMMSAQNAAFAGDPEAAGVSADIEGLKAVIEGYGRGIMLLEVTGDLYSACTNWDAWLAAGRSLGQDSIDLVNTGQLNTRLVAAIGAAFQKTQDACKAVRVSPPLSPKVMRREAGGAGLRTKKGGGAALTYPKTLDVGKKAVRLPLNVKSPGGYGKITVQRANKGIVATGGEMHAGVFGLRLTVPGKTKTGTAKLVFFLDREESADVTIKTTIELL
jgi:hypothetical protein